MFSSNPIPQPHGALRVAELAGRASVTPATIRYYARIGLLSPDREVENGYRCFSTVDLHRVEFIRRAQRLGLTIGDIKIILETAEHGDVPCDQVKSLVEQRLASMQERIADLKATESRVIKALDAWENMDDLTPLDGELCPLIERVAVQAGVVADASLQQTGRHVQGERGSSWHSSGRRAVVA